MTQTDRKASPGRLAHEIAARFKEQKRRGKIVSALSKNALNSMSSSTTVQQLIAENKRRRATAH